MSRRRSALESLLRVRRQAELRASQGAASVERIRLALEHEILHSATRIDEARHALRGELEGRIDSAVLRLTAQSAFVEERRRRRAIQALVESAPGREHARRALADASAQRKAVELLKARREAEESRAAAKREQAALDEIAARSAGGWA